MSRSSFFFPLHFSLVSLCSLSGNCACGRLQLSLLHPPSLSPSLPLSLFTTMDATAAARRLAAVNRHLGGGSEHGKDSMSSSSMVLSSSSSSPPIAPSAVAAGVRPAFRADCLLDGQVSQIVVASWTTRTRDVERMSSRNHEEKGDRNSIDRTFSQPRPFPLTSTCDLFFSLPPPFKKKKGRHYHRRGPGPRGRRGPPLRLAWRFGTCRRPRRRQSTKRRR